jgi:toxin ParE1/3/4
LSSLADADEAGIFHYLAEAASLRVALDYRERFRASYQLLLEHPDIGSPRPRFGRGVRLRVVDPHLVLYRHTGDAVTILRILHGKRRITPRLLRADP